LQVVQTLFSHVTVGVADVQAARHFYNPLLGELGFITKFASDSWAGWRHPSADRPLFIVTEPFDGDPASIGNGQMVAFLASSRSLVGECYILALELGAADEGRPGLRPHYHQHYYGAYFRDPDGNKLCVCCHEPE
jgi:catechol 2,3-dioxygenase-like lactoylglutathione lyase family enzyme